MGAEYVGEEWVLLNSNGKEMQGLVTPLEISRWHVASLPHVRSAVNLRNRCAFQGIGILDRLLKIVSSEGFEPALCSEACRERPLRSRSGCGRPWAPSAIFQHRIRSAGAR